VVTPPPQKTIKIGVVLSETGRFAPFGEPVGEGLRMAKDELDAKGGSTGRKFELVFEDDHSDAQLAAKAFEKLASADKVMAVIGPTSTDATRATASLAEKFGVIQITPTAHDSDLANLPNTFVLFPTVEQTSARAAKIAVERFKAKKVAVINPGNSWGERSTESLKRGLGAAGAELVSAETFKEGESDFGPMLQTIARTTPQVVIYPGYYDTETLAITKAVVANSAFRDIIIIIIGAVCRDLLDHPILEDEAIRKNLFIIDEGGAFEIPGNAQSTAFHRSFRERFSHAPSAYAAASHAALFAVTTAIESASDTGQLAAAMRSLKTETAFGQLDFAGTGLNQGAVIELLRPDANRQLNVVQ
jgi:branched-chain amino acid transport system substrate-binding protein